jgi:NTE family protein
MTKKPVADRPTVLLLQGGGALGSYQAGVYEALSSHGQGPNWVIGVSIGAINASLIAGNPPERRVARLRQFWELVTGPTAILTKWLAVAPHPALEQRIGATAAVMWGQPGFFRPWTPLQWAMQHPVSYYDTSLLRQTLLDLVDFDLINAGAVRFCVGAVQVSSGNMVYFDSLKTRITPEHIMASGALPPGFPPVMIDGEPYWDGGLVSNTPLSYFMSEQPRRDSLVFQVDLFPASGKLPTTLDEVAEREKDIRYSSRTRMVTTEERERHNLRRNISQFIARLPEELRNDPLAARLAEFACPAHIDVVHLIYRPDEPQGSQKDYQFDRGSCDRRWHQGFADAQAAVAVSPWGKPAPQSTSMRTFDIAAVHQA